MNALAFEQLCQQPQGRVGVAPFLNQHIENFTFIVDGAPEPHPLAADFDNHFVEMPAAAGGGPASAKVPCKRLTEFLGPAAGGVRPRIRRKTFSPEF